MNAIDRGDRWELPLQREVVARCLVDEAVSLELGTTDRHFVLRIEGEFSVTSSGRKAQLSAQNRESLGPALALYGKTVQSCWAAKSGALDIEFTDGTSVQVAPDTRYEAWELSGDLGLRVVSGPAGTLSIWQPPNRVNDRQ